MPDAFTEGRRRHGAYIHLATVSDEIGMMSRRPQSLLLDVDRLDQGALRSEEGTC